MQIKRSPTAHPQGGLKLPVGPGLYALVDEADYPYLHSFRWFAQQSSHCVYAVRKYCKAGKTFYVKLHREILQPPPGYEVHHLNHNPLDCRRSNLVILTPQQHHSLHHSRL